MRFALLTLMLHTYIGEYCCARATASHLRLFEKQDFMYGQVQLDLSEPVCSHIRHALARFSSTQVCNIRVNSRAR